jgi:phage portal protein BeeE
MYVEYVPDALLTTDTAGRYAAYKTGLEGGWLTIDEIRAKENLPQLPESGASRGAEHASVEGRLPRETA